MTDAWDNGPRLGASLVFVSADIEAGTLISVVMLDTTTNCAWRLLADGTDALEWEREPLWDGTRPVVADHG